MATQQEVIKAFMASLDTTTLSGEAALDEAIKACSTFKSFKELRAALIRDCKNAKSGDDFLKTYCGIDFDTEDIGAITGSDAGNTESKNAADMILESSSLKNFKKNSFKVNGLTVKLGDNKNFSDLNAWQKFIWQGLYTWWVKGALDLIAESYGDNFSFTDKSSATVKEVYICFSDEIGASAYTNASYSSGLTKELYITFRHIPNIENDVDWANREFDRLVAHEFTHAVMYANVLGYPVCSSLPGFVIEGLADLTRGLENDSIKYYADKPSEFEKGLDVSKIGSYEDFMYAGGFTFFRYLARQAPRFTAVLATIRLGTSRAESRLTAARAMIPLITAATP